MCVFLCANPNVREWLDVPLARAYRESLQLSAICPDDPFEFSHAKKLPAAQPSKQTQQECQLQSRPAVRRRIAPRPRWHSAPVPLVRPSTHELQHALDAIAYAWSRLLTLMGWRR